MSLGAFTSTFPFTWEMVHGDEGWKKPYGKTYAGFDTPQGRILVKLQTYPVRMYTAPSVVGDIHTIPYGESTAIAPTDLITEVQFSRSYKNRPNLSPNADTEWHVATRVLGTIIAILRDYARFTGIRAYHFGAATPARDRIYKALAMRVMRPVDRMVRLPHYGSDLFIFFDVGDRPIPGAIRVRRSRKRGGRS